MCYGLLRRFGSDDYFVDLVREEERVEHSIDLADRVALVFARSEDEAFDGDDAHVHLVDASERDEWTAHVFAIHHFPKATSFGTPSIVVSDEIGDRREKSIFGAHIRTFDATRHIGLHDRVATSHDGLVSELVG